MSNKQLQNYIPALTGVRALAAYLVFISHFAYKFDENFPQGVQFFLREFHIGVTIFFVLSGFLIAFRYYDNFSISPQWFRQYLKNRVARIYPMYFLLTICAFVYYYFTGTASIVAGLGHPFVMLFMNITFLRGFFKDLVFTGIAQGWSLTVEECFYFSAPFMFYFAKKYGKVYLQPLAITGFGVLMVLIFRNVNWYGFFGNFTFMMLNTFFGRCFEFFVGMLLALFVKKHGFERKSRVPFTYVGFVAIFVLVYCMSILPLLPGNEFGQQHPMGIVINNYLIATSIALFFYGLLTERTVMKSILANPFVELLGKASYIFYLIHLGFSFNIFLNSINWLNDEIYILYDKWGVEWHSPFENDGLNLLFIFILLNALSIFLYKFIEEPVNLRIRKSNFLVKGK